MNGDEQTMGAIAKLIEELTLSGGFSSTHRKAYFIENFGRRVVEFMVFYTHHDTLFYSF